MNIDTNNLFAYIASAFLAILIVSNIRKQIELYLLRRDLNLLSSISDEVFNCDAINTYRSSPCEKYLHAEIDKLQEKFEKIKRRLI